MLSADKDLITSNATLLTSKGIPANLQADFDTLKATFETDYLYFKEAE